MPSKKKIEENLKKVSIGMTSIKIPHVFLHLANTGPVVIGTPSLVQKLKEEFKEWDAAMNADQEILNNNTRENRTTLATEKGKSPHPLLPADLHLMRFNELTKYIRIILLKKHWASGGNSQRIIPGHPDFQASFWPEDIWPWHQVKKSFQNLRKNEFPGPGNLTEFLKKVIRNFFEEENIDAENHVSELFTDQERKRRQKKRGDLVPSTNSSSSEEINNLPKTSLFSSSGEDEEGEYRRKMPEELNKTRDDSTDLSDIDHSRTSNVEDEELRTNISPVLIPTNTELDNHDSEAVEDNRGDVNDEAMEEQRSSTDRPSSWNEDDGDLSNTEDDGDGDRISYEKEKHPSNNTETTEEQSFNSNELLTSTFKDISDFKKIINDAEFHYEVRYNISDNRNVGLGEENIDQNNSFEFSIPKTNKQGKKSVKPKKCRAQYGLDNKESWCKACRNKKKCTVPSSHEKEEVAKPSSELPKDVKDLQNVNLSLKFLDKILHKYREEVDQIFGGRCNSKRHVLFFRENYDLKRAKILNEPDNQLPVLFSNSQQRDITVKCDNIYMERNGMRAFGEKQRYLEYVIIPEIQIMILRFLKNMSTNYEAEMFLMDNYRDYHGETFAISGFD